MPIENHKVGMTYRPGSDALHPVAGARRRPQDSTDHAARGERVNDFSRVKRRVRGVGGISICRYRVVVLLLNNRSDGLGIDPRDSQTGWLANRIHERTVVDNDGALEEPFDGPL